MVEFGQKNRCPRTTPAIAAIIAQSSFILEQLKDPLLTLTATKSTSMYKRFIERVIIEH